MGYNIHIGQARLESGKDENELYAYWDVDVHTEEEAPSFEGDEMTGKSNSRYPSYSQWANFCKEVGLYEIFFNEDNGLMRPHPGCRPLSKEHLEIFKKALKEREEKDKRPAGLDERYRKDEFQTIPEGEETHDYNKVRLIWLIFWTDWALKNCTNPAIKNS